MDKFLGDILIEGGAIAYWSKTHEEWRKLYPIEKLDGVANSSNFNP